MYSQCLGFGWFCFDPRQNLRQSASTARNCPVLHRKRWDGLDVQVASVSLGLAGLAVVCAVPWMELTPAEQEIFTVLVGGWPELEMGHSPVSNDTHRNTSYFT